MELWKEEAEGQAQQVEEEQGEKACRQADGEGAGDGVGIRGESELTCVVSEVRRHAPDDEARKVQPRRA